MMDNCSFPLFEPPQLKKLYQTGVIFQSYMIQLNGHNIFNLQAPSISNDNDWPNTGPE